MLLLIPPEISPKVLWPRLATTPDFYALLPWMEGSGAAVTLLSPVNCMHIPHEVDTQHVDSMLC